MLHGHIEALTKFRKAIKVVGALSAVIYFDTPVVVSGNRSDHLFQTYCTVAFSLG
jgi:hypothetical protein